MLYAQIELINFNSNMLFKAAPNFVECYHKNLIVLEINAACKPKQPELIKMTQKTTDEIRELLSNAELDFDSVQNKALNHYLPKIFLSCPFTEEICTTKQCLECSVFHKHHK
jgi:hypothetical protein